jgi:hypothetical protein
MDVPGMAQRQGGGYAGGARAGTCRAEHRSGELKCCSSGAGPVGIRAETRSPAGAGSIAWWLKWQMGQLSGEDVA